MPSTTEEQGQAWKHLFDAVNDAVLILSKDGEVLSYNGASRRLFGPLEQIQSIRWEKPEWKSILDQLKPGGTELFHGCCLCADGSERAFPVSLVQLEDKTIQVICRTSAAQQETPVPDQVIESSLATLDLVDSDKDFCFADRQLQLIHTEKMASLGQIAAGISHEISNPLAFVTSNLDVLARYMATLKELVTDYREACQSLTPELQKSLQEKEKASDLDYLLEDLPSLVSESQEGAHRASEIIRSLKTFVRKDHAGLEETDLVEQLETTLTILGPHIDKDHKVATEFEELPPVRCFPGQISQVFLNLILNAIQAVNKNGCIVVSTRAFADHVEVKIKDNGPGMSEEKLEKIFQPFYTTKPAGVGTGLGLSISQRIVDAHGGKIHVESEVDKGTSFTVMLPLDSSES